jgi:glycosyltransferase involved in cell wall biosynthesis
MLLVTNFPRFPVDWQVNGHSGRSIYAANTREFLQHRSNPEAVFVVNCDPRLTCDLAAALLVGQRRPLVAVDIVLRRPEGWRSWLQYPALRVLVGRVDHFIHYFRDVSGLERAFGIGEDRSSYVPFKVNLVSRHKLEPRPDGAYVLCFGRSMRDYNTFFAAMERLPYPGALTRPDPIQLAQHKGRLSRRLDQIPSNIRLLEDDGTEQSEIQILSGAKVLVLPIRKDSLVASGISTAMNAMYLGKCVVGSAGPGMTDIFDKEIVSFPPEEPGALADAIRRVWENDELRLATAAAGRRFALAAGAEPELYKRVIGAVANWYWSC